MKLVACVLTLFFTASLAAGAVGNKASVSVSDGSMIIAADQLAKSAGVSIVVDPAVDARVTLSLNDVELTTALDMLTKTAKCTWKKVVFAQPSDSKVTMDQIKTTVLTLASMPLMAASVDDGSGNGRAMFTKGVSSSPKTSDITLPEGYTWTTVYAILSTDKPVRKEATAKATGSTPVKPSLDSGKTVDQANKAFSKPVDLANMAPEDRRRLLQDEMMGYMTLTPEARRQVLRDQMSAAAAMDPQMREQYRRDLRDAMRVLNPPKQNRTPRNGTPSRTR